MGDVIRFARPTNDAPLPKPPQPMKPPAGADPHTYFSTIMRLWCIGAEHFCGLDWAMNVAANAHTYLAARRVFKQGTPKT